MNNLNLSPKAHRRTNLFFGQYRYCLRGYQPEFHCLRRLSHSSIDIIMRARREWGRQMHQRQPGSWHWAPLEITDLDVANLHAMCNFLLGDSRERKLVISGSWFYFYTNDRSFVIAVMGLPWLDQDRLQWSEVELYGHPNAVIRQQTQHGLRSYFRNLILDDRKRVTLVTILKQQEDIRLSPSLRQWVEHPRWSRTLDYHFIDHNDSSILTLLGLIEPHLIRRTLPIVAHK